MIEQIFLDSADKRFRQYRELGEKTFAQLDDEDLLRQPNGASNSIAVIVRHLHGNMISRWTNFLTEDGEKPWRKRDEEFEEAPVSRAELMRLWNEGWDFFLGVLATIKAEDLARTVTARNEPMTVVDAINRQLTHYAYHVGQIVYLGRWMKQDAWTSLSIPKRK